MSDQSIAPSPTEEEQARSASTFTGYVSTGAYPTVDRRTQIVGYVQVVDPSKGTVTTEPVYGTIEDSSAGNTPTVSVTTDTIHPLVGGLVDALNWIEVQLRTIRGAAIQIILDNLNNPAAFFALLAGSFVAQALLQWAYDYLKGIDFVSTVVNTITSFASIVTSTMAFFQVDTLYTLISLGSVFSNYIDSQLLAVYKALGSLSKEIQRDFSFVTSFAEVNRSILYTANRLLPNPWVSTQLQYAQGFSVFLGNVKSKLSAYVSDPEKIFLDLSEAISRSRVLEVTDDFGPVAAQASLAAEFVQRSGRILIEGLDSVKSIVDGMDPDLIKRIGPWWKDFTTEWDDFKKKTFEPLDQKLTRLRTDFDETVRRQGIDIDALKQASTDPLTFILSLLGLEDTDRMNAERMLRRAFNEIDRRDAEDRSRALSTFLEARKAVTVNRETSSVPLPETPSDVSFSPLDRTGESAAGNGWFVGEPSDSLSETGSGSIRARSWYVGE